MIDEGGELFVVGAEIVNRTGCDAAFHCGARNGRGDLEDEARVERFRDDVVWSEDQVFLAVGGNDDVRGFALSNRG